MVNTHGLTHIALKVRDMNRSFQFYKKIFGVVEVYRGEQFIQVQTPGSRDVVVFEQHMDNIHGSGGILHFGFRLTKEQDIDQAIDAVREAGGKILSHGEFCPGEPYVFFADPDGYHVEIWHELPTPVDPL